MNCRETSSHYLQTSFQMGEIYENQRDREIFCAVRDFYGGAVCMVCSGRSYGPGKLEPWAAQRAGRRDFCICRPTGDRS